MTNIWEVTQVEKDIIFANFVNPNIANIVIANILMTVRSCQQHENNTKFYQNDHLYLSLLGKTSPKKECLLSGIAQISSPPSSIRATWSSFSDVKNDVLRE